MGIHVLDIHHFSYGWLTPILAYIMSFTGSLLGLQCAARARAAEGRAGWLVLAAFAIGGTGIWVMHFIAMLGFSIRGAEIRYDVPLTLLSAATAIVVVGIGLFVVVTPRPTLVALFAGGTVTGLGVAAMHYLGMFAMKSSATIGYDLPTVVLSVAIAVIAATVALWFTLRVNGFLATTGAAGIMGLAVCGMHYTGMASMHAHHAGHDGPVAGTGAMQLLAPLIVGISIVTMLLLIAVSLTSIEHDIDLPPLRAASVRPAAEDVAPAPPPRRAPARAIAEKFTPAPPAAARPAVENPAPIPPPFAERSAAQKLTSTPPPATVRPATENLAPTPPPVTARPFAENLASTPPSVTARPFAENLAPTPPPTTVRPFAENLAPTPPPATARPFAENLAPTPPSATVRPFAEDLTATPSSASTGTADSVAPTPPPRPEPTSASIPPVNGTPYWPTTRDVPRRK
ncbi:MHYT domain-containing protein [Nocardia xishanensis]|uniref:MHYT domain-containing protein n=1 Tax=Nocardia xishanensis TaxID=238964 RepID=A0ABW7WSE7_9NOCA